MSIQRRFNLIFVITFLVGLGLASSFSYILELEEARQDSISQARLILANAMAIRNYTVQEIRPLLQSQDPDHFVPQTVPAFAAHETFELMQDEFPEHSYREVALNPTNPRDRANELEVELIREFRTDPAREEILGERKSKFGEILYLARPIRITNEACLECHSTPDTAPAAMIASYGSSNGFGWQLNEVVGTQIVSVPLSIAKQKAQTTVFTLLISLFTLFALIFVILNWVLRRFVVMPLREMSNASNQVSLGQANRASLPVTQQGELGKLAISTKRLHESLDKALKLLNEKNLVFDFPDSLYSDLEEAKELWIVGGTLDRTLELNYSLIESKLLQGDRINVLTMNPNNETICKAEAMRSLEDKDEEGVAQRIQTSLAAFSFLQERTRPDKMEIRVLDQVFSFGGLIMDTGTSSGIMYLWTRPLKQNTDDRPKIVIRPDNGAAFQFYTDELKEMWEQAVIWKDEHQV